MFTKILVAVNVVVFIWEWFTGAFGPQYGYTQGGHTVVTYDPMVAHGAIYGPAIFGRHEYWRVLSGAFLHGGLLHIGVNMFALWQVGSVVEAIMGTPRMALVYFCSAIAAGFAAAYFNYGEPVVGASGAIFGLFGALVAIGLRHGARGRGLIAQTLPIIILNLVIGFSIPHIANSAHIGGLVAGFAFGFLFYQVPQVIRARVTDAQTGEELESQFYDRQ
jgi:rhomboid protease GluP